MPKVPCFRIYRKITLDKTYPKLANTQNPELPFSRNDDYASDLEYFGLEGN